MRLDKYLKVSQIIKRREIAKQCIDRGLVTLNGKVAKAASSVEVNDLIVISSRDEVKKYRVLIVKEHATKEQAKEMYEVLWFYRSF